MMSLPQQLNTSAPRLLSALESERLEREQRAAARSSLLRFTERTVPRWSPGPIHRAICEQLERVQRREVDRLMLLCPPQHGKSTISSKRAPAWFLGLDPTIEVISASATAQLAEEFGGEVRNTVAAPDYAKLFPSTKLREDSKARGRWLTDQGGGYYAVGIGGALFGRGAELAIIDDPFATWEDAQSEVSRARVWSWYTGTLYNRVRPGGAIVVIQHRMHEDDLVGKLLDAQSRGGDKWQVVELPADPENPPWPERYDKPALERIRDNMPALQWSALYMQQPAPADGDYFKADWFGEYEQDQIPQDCAIFGASDYAVSIDDGDYTEHGVFAVDRNHNIYAIDWWFGKTAPDEWIERKCDLILAHKPRCWFGEGGVIRKAIEPFMMRRMSERSAFCRVEWLPSISDKATRARSIQARASMGKVRLPKFAPWKSHVLTQLLKFPTGRNDDAVDVFSLIGRGLEFVRVDPEPMLKPLGGAIGRYST
jgi:predicted phage terminase large subunit-like protein